MRAKARTTVAGLSATVLLACWAFGTQSAVAQSALDVFDPNANGEIKVIVVQPDGKILIGGNFSTLAPNGGAPVTRNNIARLNMDGTLDTGFDPNANGFVDAIVVNGPSIAGFRNPLSSRSSLTRQPTKILSLIRNLSLD